MSNNIKEKTTEQRKQEKVAADMAAKKRQSGIRCYSSTGFFAPVTQPDGTVKKQFIYGRDGD